MSTIIPGRLDALLARCRREVDEGRIPGGQLAVGFENELVCFEAIGEATTDQRFHIFSATKPTVSLTVLELAAEGSFDLEAPVAAVLPSFGENGKDHITLSQMLLHAGGFPHAPMPAFFWGDRSGRLRRYAQWHTTWEPGTAFEYHATSAHWVLADLITEATGRPHADVITERIMEPAGARRWLGIEPADQGDVVDTVTVGEAPDLSNFLERFGVEPPETEVTNEALEAFNDPALREAGNPGGGGLASAADLASWYQAILHDDGEVLRPEVKRDALTEIRQNHPDWMGCPANRTHAFILAGDHDTSVMRGFGHGLSAFSFGHGGAKGQLGWADPESGVSVGFVTNGLDQNDLVSGHRAAAISSYAAHLTTPID